MSLRIYTIIILSVLGLASGPLWAAEMFRHDRLIESETNDLDSNYNVEKQLCKCVEKINNQCIQRVCKKIKPKSEKNLRDH